MSQSADQEDRRLRELQRFQILDTRREPEFDGLCELARSVIGVDVAAIGFVDRDRVWYKAVSGLPLIELPRGATPCDIAVRLGEVLEVEDIAEDRRFDDEVDFLREAGFRFVAAFPLEVRKGIHLGTLCVAGTVPRRLTPRERGLLEQIRQAVIDRLRLHRIRIERSRENARKRAKDAEIAAQRSEIVRQRRILEQTSRLARIGGWEYEVESRRLVWSDEIYRILELDFDYAPVFEEIPRFYREDVRASLVGEVRRALLEGRPFELEAPVLTVNQKLRWVRFVCEAEMVRGSVTRLIGTVQDTTEQRATEEQASFIARHDVMTRLPNRAVFQSVLESALVDGASAEPVGLVLLDLDHFKEVNDTLGHQAGDVLLAEVARRLTAAAGPNALVARLGGDEFGILLTRTSVEQLAALARTTMGAFVEPVLYGDDSIPVTVSMGVAVGVAGESADQLLKDADIALYEAKGAGRNRWVVFDRSMRDEIELRQSILRAIRQAIDRKELILYYQPKVALQTGQLDGFEALLRWRRPDGFVAGPSFFGVALEDTVLSQVIGDIVIDIAVRQAAAWQKAGFDFGHIAINVSPSQFRRGDFADHLLGALADHRVPPSALMVEVTENVLLSRETDNLLGTLQTLADHGVSIALDDFGTGYASLTHLKEFPVDLLKIDRSFVSAIIERRESLAIVRGITALAHDLGIEVIAEGIERPEQRDTLRRLGVNTGQGYLFARPMPPEQAERDFLTPQVADLA